MRRIIAALTAAVMWLAVLPVATAPVIFLTGCSTTSVASVEAAFISSAQAIVDADPNGPEAADLTMAIASMKSAQGINLASVTCAFESGADIAVKIIDSIAPGSPVALIATIAVAGFDALQPFLPACPVSITGPVPTVKALVATHTSLRHTSAYAGHLTAINKAWFPVHAYKARFNQAAKDSGLKVRI